MEAEDASRIAPESEKLKASLLKFSQLLKINFGLIDEEEDRVVL